MPSSRLADSPAVVVVDENDPSVQMQQILKSMGQTDFEEAKPILEINVEDPMVKKIENSNDEQYIEQLSSVLLDQGSPC